MGTISGHSNQSSYQTRIKNTIYVEANVFSMYAKLQLHPSLSFLRRFCKTKQTIYVEDDVINMYEKYQLHPPYGF